MEKPHKKLDVWKLSMDFVIDIYRKTEGFPKEERYALTDQIRRAAVSIPSNIAEGAARQTKKEFINYLHIAQGSLSELDTQFEIAKRLSYLSEADWKPFDEKIRRIDKMITGLIGQQRKLLS
ncbi:MAG: four helix bundle protein [Bacteroidetes bacterium]|nr:four helix bundle protein [Bacteroidota bacterium]